MCGLFNDFLPHFSNLAKHRLIKDVLCPLCNNPLKDANQLNQTFQALWSRRNKLVHEGQKGSVQDILGFIHGYMQELNQTQNPFHSMKPMMKDLW